MNENTWKGFFGGLGAGLVAWWAVDRLYKMARANSTSDALVPYCVGAMIGSAYGLLVLRGDPPAIARAPLGAAVYLADPSRTLPRGSRSLPEKIDSLAFRLVSRGLKTVAERALHA